MRSAIDLAPFTRAATSVGVTTELLRTRKSLNIEMVVLFSPGSRAAPFSQGLPIDEPSEPR